MAVPGKNSDNSSTPITQLDAGALSASGDTVTTTAALQKDAIASLQDRIKRLDSSTAASSLPTVHLHDSASLADKGQSSVKQQIETAISKTETDAKFSRAAQTDQNTDQATAPKIEWVAQADNQTNRKQPDITISKTGDIAARSGFDLESNLNSKIVVEFEGTKDLTKAQKDKAVELYETIATSIQEKNNNQTQPPAAPEPPTGAISDFDQNAQHAAAGDQYPAGGGHGQMNLSNLAQAFAPYMQGNALVDTTTNQSSSTNSTQFERTSYSPGGQPIDPVDQFLMVMHPFSSRAGAVGDFGLTGELMTLWLKDALGDPPDPQKLAELAKAYPMMAGLLAKYKAGKSLTADDLKTVPKEVQDKVAHDLGTKFAQQTGNDHEKMGLAWKLGKNPNQLSASDYSKPENASFMKQVKHEESNESGKVSDGAKELAHKAKNYASKVDTVGHCYARVADVLDTMGVHLKGGSAYMAADQLAKNDKFIEVSKDQIKEGDVIVHGAGYMPGHNDGHITVALGNHMEASDHVQSLITSNKERVFRLKDTDVA